MKIPREVWNAGDASVVACDGKQFELLWQGSYVRSFPDKDRAIRYAQREFLNG